MTLSASPSGRQGSMDYLRITHLLTFLSRSLSPLDPIGVTWVADYLNGGFRLRVCSQMNKDLRFCA